MKPAECKKLVSGYLAWVRKGLTVHELKRGGTCVITTPFVNRINDCLQVFAERKGGMVCLHDGGDVLAELKFLSIDFKSPDQKDRLEIILNDLAVRTDGKRLFVKVSEEDVGLALNNLIQAMLAVGDLYVWATTRRRKSYFDEDVSSFLKSNSVRFSHRVNLTGRSGFKHYIDYLVPDSDSAPERIIKAINSPNKSSISHYLFALEDIRKERKNGVQTLALLNDSRAEVKDGIFGALEAYQVQPVLWSERKKFVKQLAA